MIMPWTAAPDLMRSYYDRKGQEWPEFSACRLLDKIRIRNTRWVNRALLNEANALMVNAAVDVDDLAEYHLGLRLRIEHLNELDAITGAQVFGLAIPERNEIVVCERAERYEPLYRATVMHEIAHILLHGESRKRVVAYSPESKTRPPEEREADQFMHEALLPRAVLLVSIARLTDIWGIDIREALAGANSGRGRWQWKNRFFLPLINNLVVSRHMLSLKLKSMAYFSERTVRYHLSYPLATRWINQSGQFPLRRAVDSVHQRCV